MKITDAIKVKKFEGLTVEWLEMIKENRSLGGIQHDFDILIAQKEILPFEDAYLAFAESPVYEALQNTETVMWYESPEYIVDEYYRKK